MDQLAKRRSGPQRQAGRPGVVQLHLHDGRLGRAVPAAQIRQLAGMRGLMASPTASSRRRSRPTSVKAERSAVLHLHARRPQGPGGHGAEDRELRLPDAPPGRRDPGPGGDRGRLRHRRTACHRRRWSKAARSSRACATASSAAWRRSRSSTPRRREVLVGGAMLDGDALIDVLEAAGVDESKVRTPLTCDTRFGICAKC